MSPIDMHYCTSSVHFPPLPCTKRLLGSQSGTAAAGHHACGAISAKSLRSASIPQMMMRHHRVHPHGTRMAVQENTHSVMIPIPSHIKAEVVLPTKIMLSCTDKHLLGLFAAKVRSWRKPEAGDSILELMSFDRG